MAKRNSSKGVPPGSPLATGAGQTGETLTTAGWSGDAPEPIWYRSHVGGGPEGFLRSMQTLVAVKTRDDLQAQMPPGATLIAVIPFGLDARNTWYTHLVRAQMADGAIQTVGFTSAAIEW